ncbi:MAG TPA: family 78 glycoside hydrolase catalytic domain [Puia sp.]
MKPLVSLFFLFVSFGVRAQEIKLVDLRCEYRVNPIGIGTGTPKLSWELASSKRGVVQSAYRILVAEDSVSLMKNTGLVWDSKKVESDVSIGVLYNGPALVAGRSYCWKLMVWDEARKDSSKWSHIGYWRTGLLTAADWKGARWIGYAEIPDSSVQLPAPSVKGFKKSGPARDVLPLFRKEFVVGKPLLRATAFISGLGHFEMRLNGKKAGDHFLDPGWVTYDKKALYVGLDITADLKQGVNAVGVMLGNGFYYIPRERYHKLLTAYGYPKMIARIVLEYQDGSVSEVISDTSWKTAAGPITFSSIYGGEDYDARLEQAGWDGPGFNDEKWRQPVVVKGPPVLEAQSAEPLKVMEQFAARRIVQKPVGAGGTGGGTFVYDLGQNASGIVRIKVRGPKGTVVRITPGELLGEDSLANQKATGKPYYWEYTLKGDGVETWEPRFTYYGFRYLQVDGNAEVVELTGLHTRNSMETAGKFKTSNRLFNRTDTLINWAIKSNVASVWTDCPHREKLGWLEEAHLMGSSVRYNYDITSLYRKIVYDMMDAQTADGLVPEIAPEYTVFGSPFRDSPEWGSSCVLVPWYLYQWYGDQETLAAAYPMMKRYLEYLGKQASGHILSEGLGDWYDIGPAHPGVSQLTPKGVTATAIYYYDLSILSRIARLLGHADEGQGYASLAVEVRKAFNDKFFDQKTGQVASGSQAANAMALYMGLVPDGFRDSVLANIVRDLRQRRNSLTAGDIGFRYLLKVLDEGGRSDVIFDMNSRSDVPGYGYQLAKGATALTESWQAYPSVSNNHFMLGHIMEWFYDGLAGITTSDSSTAFHHSIIKPQPVGDVQWVQADYHSPYGLIASHWKRVGGVFDLSVTIPANTTATVYLPAAAGAVITEGWKAIEGRPDIRLVRWDKGMAVFELGSGSYNFRSTTENKVSAAKMASVYEQVKTPYKYGLVMVPPERSKKMDCPSIFRKGDSWYMVYIIFDGRGYETWLAKSPDLLHWTTKGRIMSFSDSASAGGSRWDGNQKAGYTALEDYDWGGDYKLQPYKGKYWMSYFGGNTRGYEAGVLSEGMAFTDKDPATVHEWQRLDKPILTVKDSSVAWWDNHTMYKSWVLWDKRKLTGHPFVLYYNANGDSLDRRRGSERIGMAVSDDMVHWTRPRRDPVLDHLTGITGDPYIQKMGDLYVMFYFGAFWQGKGGAFNRFACSYDLVHWTDWTGPDLISSSEPYDEVFAHKSFVINYKGTVYHFYCGVDKKGNRGIAVATSKDMGKSELNFAPAPGRVNFDAGWKFFLGDDSAARGAAYDDSKWRTLDLPHDWSIEGKFDSSNPTGQGEGGLPAGVGWYRKSFAGNFRYIDFDGVYRNSEVWINGHYLGKRPNGYISFRYEMGPWLNKSGENVLAVRVDNSKQPNSRWYSGSGIYRHVWVSDAAPDYFVHTREVSAGSAKIVVNGNLPMVVYDADGKKLAAGKGEVVLNTPHLWSPDHPYLYTVKINDDYTVAVGIRWFRFDVSQGFILNGKPLKIKGVCMHHDLGALGAAVNTSAIIRQLRLLKEMGCNAVRTAHNPPAPEFLDLCDQMGFIVMDEAFDMWRKKKNKYDYSLDFPQWGERDLRDQVMRDRNHPSVFIWSIGNEIREQFDTTGIGIARRLAAIVREVDPTRPVTSALTETDTTKNFIYRSGTLDLIGLNYNHALYDSVPVKYPGHPFIATETTSALETRGHYDGPADSLRRWPAAAKARLVGANPDYTVSAYDNVYAYWGATHEATWKAAKRNPAVSGLFVWAGFDYIGEPTPYPWPARSSYFGIIDLAGFPKDIYYMYQSEWTAKPVLHILPHWNWGGDGTRGRIVGEGVRGRIVGEGVRGRKVDVWAYYSQADEVELFLNGRSLGIRRKKGEDLHVSWSVNWEPGVLKAVSRSKGKIVLVREVRTAGAAVRIELSVDKKMMQADGSDLAFITARVTDASGQLVPDAGNELTAHVEGEGELAGMDNGYQASLEYFRGTTHAAYNGLCLVIVRAKRKAGKIVVTISGKGLEPASIELTAR